MRVRRILIRHGREVRRAWPHHSFCVCYVCSESNNDLDLKYEKVGAGFSEWIDRVKTKAHCTC